MVTFSLWSVSRRAKRVVCQGVSILTIHFSSQECLLLFWPLHLYQVSTGPAAPYPLLCRKREYHFFSSKFYVTERPDPWPLVTLSTLKVNNSFPEEEGECPRCWISWYVYHFKPLKNPASSGPLDTSHVTTYGGILVAGKNYCLLFEGRNLFGKTIPSKFSFLRSEGKLI